MDTAQLIATSGLSVGILAILFGIFALMWQMNRQSSRLETMIEAQGEEIKAQGRDLEAKIEAQGKDLEAKIEAQSEDIKEQGTRVSQAELEQARLNGVNSVLVRQIHSHGNLGDSD